MYNFKSLKIPKGKSESAIVYFVW